MLLRGLRALQANSAALTVPLQDRARLLDHGIGDCGVAFCGRVKCA